MPAGIGSGEGADINARILVFAKAPLAGKVKTRLGRSTGYLRAARLYREMLGQTLNRVCAIEGVEVELWCAPNTAHRYFRDCAARWPLTLHPQGTGGLGDRMQKAARAALGRSDVVLLLGGDCVSVTTAHIAKALDLLDQGNDAVMAPAEDGGYVLLGLRAAPGRLFQAISWSTSAVALTTRKRMRQLGFDWAELPELWDLDRPADLKRWKRQKIK